MNAIRTAQPSEVDTIVGILVAAFHDDPISGWVFPGDERRRTGAHPAFFRTIVDAAFADGRIDVVEDYSAAMVWVPGAQEEDEGPPPGLVPDEEERLGVLYGMMTERAPSEPPHWHAQFLGVLPGRQRQGLGGRLFRYGLEISDADGLPTYLEASTPENARLYRRLGFADHGPAFFLPDGPPMQPMWRDPG